MTDIATIWDAAHGRGDWAFDPIVPVAQQLAANQQGFGTGNGAATQFQVSDSLGPVFNAQVTSIYKLDWQGSQLQYATPRTNVALSSQQIGAAPWTVLNATSTLNGGVGPDGTSTASLLVEDATSNYHRVFQAQSTYARNVSVPIGLFVKRASGTRNVGLQLTDSGINYGWIDYDLTAATATPRVSGGAAVSNAGIAALANGWFFCFAKVTVNSASATVGSSLFVYMETGTTPLYVGDGASGLYLWGAMIGTNGGYIPTTTAAVTVTDYALSGTGLATFASAPASGAALTWNGAYERNAVAGSGDLRSGSDLQTAVLISLFTDRVANGDDAIPDGTADPRGWWADDQQYPIGSRLWLLGRAKQDQLTLIRAKDYIAEALQWLKDDGVVASFDVYVEWSRPSVLGMQVVAHKPNGTSETMQFAGAWKGIN